MGLSIVPQNIFFNFLCTLPDPYEEERHYKIFDRYYGLVMGEIPISFQKIYPIRSNAPRPMFASFELGFKYNFVVDYALYITSYIDVIGDSGVLIFQQWHEPVRTSLESYFFKCGIIRISRGDKIMQYNLVFNYSPKNIIGGSYVFENLPFESYGSVSQGINYIGFEFSYGLIRKKQKSI